MSDEERADLERGAFPPSHEATDEDVVLGRTRICNRARIVLAIERLKAAGRLDDVLAMRGPVKPTSGG